MAIDDLRSEIARDRLAKMENGQVRGDHLLRGARGVAVGRRRGRGTRDGPDGLGDGATDRGRTDGVERARNGGGSFGDLPARLVNWFGNGRYGTGAPPNFKCPCLENSLLSTLDREKKG